MAKKKDAKSAGSAGPSEKERNRQVRRLGKELDQTQDLEAKRTKQLEKLRRQEAALKEAIAVLRGGAGSRTDGLQAYCRRDRRMVAVSDASLVVTKNGRDAVAGTCAACGTRVFTTARAMVDAVRASTASGTERPAEG